MRTSSSRLSNALFVLFVAGILAYGAGFAWYMLGRFDLISLISNTHDDAFYYFQIASNLAEGKFSTFDGGITRTNGYHPIWLFLITPFYWAFDKEAALFAIKAFEIMLVAGGVALVAVAARLARLPWILLFAVLPTLYQHHTLIGGMEAAAALFMLGLFFLALALLRTGPGAVAVESGRPGLCPALGAPGVCRHILGGNSRVVPNRVVVARPPVWRILEGVRFHTCAPRSCAVARRVRRHPRVLRL